MRGSVRRTISRLRGFTLVEMMVTVILTGIVIAIVAPSMRDLLTRQRLRGVTSELQTDLQFARGEAVRRNYSVLVRFSSNADMSCYVIYLPHITGSCDCLRGATQACSGTHTEIKTVQVPRSLRVALAASSAADTIVTFDWQSGQSRPGDFRIDASSTPSGKLRTTVNAAGRPTVCSPDASVPQAPQCPD